MKKILHLVIAFCTILGFAKAQNIFSDSVYKNGDVIFIKNKKILGNTLIPNGKTKFNYVGVLFYENGTPMIYHATEPVSKCSFEDYLALSDGEFKVRRLMEQELMTKDVINTMHTFAKAKLNSHYDGKLSLKSDELYNAEFVYKMYQSALGIKLSEPKPLNELKNEPTTLDFLKEAYGNSILDEKMVVIGDIYNSLYME